MPWKVFAIIYVWRRVDTRYRVDGVGSRFRNRISQLWPQLWCIPIDKYLYIFVCVCCCCIWLYVFLQHKNYEASSKASGSSITKLSGSNDADLLSPPTHRSVVAFLDFYFFFFLLHECIDMRRCMQSNKYNVRQMRAFHMRKQHTIFTLSKQAGRQAKNQRATSIIQLDRILIAAIGKLC